MTSLLMIVGGFAGISVCMAMFYSVAQAILRDGSRRRGHLAVVVAVLAVMGALLEREIDLARTLAVPLLAAALWAFAVERGLYRVFPVLLQLFAGVLLAGYVAF